MYWLFETLSKLPVEEWKNVIVAYDNMCQLDSLKVAQRPLPLEQPYDQMWLTIQKVLVSVVIKFCKGAYIINMH